MRPPLLVSAFAHLRCTFSSPHSPHPSWLLHSPPLALRYISKEEAQPWVAWEEEPDYNGDHEWEEWLAHIDTERIERERLEKAASALIRRRRLRLHRRCRDARARAEHRKESLLAHPPGVPLSAEEVAAAEEAVATESEASVTALVGELRELCLDQRRAEVVLRHAVNKAVGARVKSNAEAFAKFKALVTDAATENPKGAEEAGCRPCRVASQCRACFPVQPEFAVPY